MYVTIKKRKFSVLIHILYIVIDTYIHLQEQKIFVEKEGVKDR